MHVPHVVNQNNKLFNQDFLILLIVEYFSNHQTLPVVSLFNPTPANKPSVASCGFNLRSLCIIINTTSIESDWCILVLNLRTILLLDTHCQVIWTLIFFRINCIYTPFEIALANLFLSYFAANNNILSSTIIFFSIISGVAETNLPISLLKG